MWCCRIHTREGKKFSRNFLSSQLQSAVLNASESIFIQSPNGLAFAQAAMHDALCSRQSSRCAVAQWPQLAIGHCLQLNAQFSSAARSLAGRLISLSCSWLYYNTSLQENANHFRAPAMSHGSIIRRANQNTFGANVRGNFSGDIIPGVHCRAVNERIMRGALN